MGFTAFLDFEFSQGPNYPKEEIISVGCVIYNDNLKEIDNFYSLCKPKINRIVSPRVSKITKIYQRDINKAPIFVSVMNSFVKILKKYDDIKFYSWGKDDWKVFKEECDVCNCKWARKYVPEIIDLQEKVFSSIKDGNKKLWRNSKNLTLTAQFYNTPQLPAHNALNDARMLAEVYKAMKIRGKYDFQKQRFERMEYVKADDMSIANRLAAEIKIQEKQSIVKRMKGSFSNHNLTRILDGNLYHIIEPILDEPLFTKRKHRRYSDYTTCINLDVEKACMILTIRSSSKTIEKELDVEEYMNIINSLLHMYSGNRKRQKNWKK